jgi:hypothetical protein
MAAGGRKGRRNYGVCFAGDRSGPYAAAVSVAEPEAERLDPEPAAERAGRNRPLGAEKPGAANGATQAASRNQPPAHPPWIRRLSEYERRESSEVHGPRYG